MKKNELNELLTVNKIELISFTTAKGFTKEQTETIINRLIEAFNNETTDDYINIKINRFEMQINNTKEAILQTLNKFHAKLQEAETSKENNKIFNQLKNKYDKVILIDNTYLSDGNMAINKDYVGDLLPINENNNNYVFTKQKINELIGNNLIKANNYVINNKIQCFKSKYVVFVKNDDFIAFNQKYFDLIKKCKKNKVELYLTENKQTLLFYDTENHKIIGLIMAVLIRNKDDLDLKMIQKNENNNNIDDKTTIIQLLNPKAIENMQKVFNEATEKMINSKEYKELIKNESEDIMTNKQHVNAVTKHVYTGNNAELLEKAGFNSFEWVGSGQARKLKKQIKKGAKGVTIKVYKENEDGQTFCKFEKVYNVENELEDIKPVEKTTQFADMVNKFKNMFIRKRA